MPEPPTAIGTLQWALRRTHDAAPGWEHPAAIPLLADLTPRHALFRSPPATRCIWEILLHMTAWRSTVARRLTGEDAPLDQPWPPLPDAASRGESDSNLLPLWKDAVDRYRLAHADLLESLGSLEPSRPHPHPDFEGHPHWIAALGAQIHDSYHLGQIALLRALQGLPHVE